jgi:hypothetical protein
VVKRKMLLFCLVLSLGVVFVATGPAHAGPTYLLTAKKANLMNSYGCEFVGMSSDAYKYKCSNDDRAGGFMLATSGGYSPTTGREFSCHFYGRNWTTGAFDQNWHHSAMVGGESSPLQACSLDQESENTWFAAMNTTYGYKQKPPKNTDPYTKRNSGF